MKRVLESPEHSPFKLFSSARQSITREVVEPQENDEHPRRQSFSPQILIEKESDGVADDEDLNQEDRSELRWDLRA